MDGGMVVRAWPQAWRPDSECEGSGSCLGRTTASSPARRRGDGSTMWRVPGPCCSRHSWWPSSLWKPSAPGPCVTRARHIHSSTSLRTTQTFSLHGLEHTDPYIFSTGSMLVDFFKEATWGLFAVPTLVFPGPLKRNSYEGLYGVLVRHPSRSP